MKKVTLVLLLCVVLMVILPFAVRAQTMDEMYNEQLEASGADELFDSLPDDTRDLLSRVGINDLSIRSMRELQPQTAWSSLQSLFSDRASGPLSAMTTMLGAVLFLGFFGTLQPSLGGQTVTFRVIGMLVVVTPLLVPLWLTFERTQAACESASVFSLAFAPVYAALLTAQGSAVTALSYQTVMLAAAEGISLLIGTVVLPLISVSFALGAGGAVNNESRLSEVGAMLNRIAVWLIGIALTIFVGMLSLQSVLAASADSVSGRVLRFSVAGFVPIVGGHLAEALYTVRGCLSALKGSVGGFGILSTVCIVLPTLLECVVWNLTLGLATTGSSLFALPEVRTVLESAQKAVKALIAVLASSALLMIVSVTVVTLAGGGTV